jgi:N-acylneuraminate cytidylyltransferase
MNQGRAVAILLARGGSKGIPGKNLKQVGGLSLVARSVLAARAARSVEAVYVSTDDAAIAQEAARFGARIIHRPADLADDAATSESGWLHALRIIREQMPDVSRLVLLQCTSPFTTGADIDGCLRVMAEQDAACALSVVEDHSFLWTFDADGRGVGINHDETKQRQRRQDLPPAFRESGAVYCVRVEDFERVGRRFCGPVALFPVDHPPVEIDSVADLQLCDLIARQAGRGFGDGEALVGKLRKVKAVVMDFDGVHTNDTVIVDQNGVESVIVSRRDGMGIERLRRSQRYRLLILSKERNPVVARRAEKLQVECLHGIENKVDALRTWLADAGLDWSEMLYVGNDINDAGPLERAGVAACPSDAHPDVLPLADWIVPQAGGQGVLRAIADRLLADG